jgi:2-amino-4-hydroxy-6-hydroxymethyldihydropteridine diphosphokinase
MPRALVALGSNLGDRKQLLARAGELLAATPGVARVVASAAHETAPVGGPAGQPSFLNAAAALDTTLSASDLHAALVHIERHLGRTRTQRWGSRTIDLDLLLYGTDVIDTPSLTVPHPRMAYRRFVLAPAAEIAPDMLHPTSGWTIAQLLAHLDKAAPYVALMGPPGAGKTDFVQRLCAAFAGRFIADPPAKPGESPPPTSSGPVYDRQIEFLVRRTKCLSRIDWPQGEALAVSDFYFDQCLAYARCELGAAELASFDQAVEAAREHVVVPKLVVFANPAEHRGDARLVEELTRLARRQQVGPVLSIGATDDAALQEVAAAIEAMR